MAGPKGKPAAGAGSDEMKFITMKVVGGEPPSNAVLSAKLAPFGCNPKKAGETISKGTQEYTNIRTNPQSPIPILFLLLFYLKIK